MVLVHRSSALIRPNVTVLFRYTDIRFFSEEGKWIEGCTNFLREDIFDLEAVSQTPLTSQKLLSHHGHRTTLGVLVLVLRASG